MISLFGADGLPTEGGDERDEPKPGIDYGASVNIQWLNHITKISRMGNESAPRDLKIKELVGSMFVYNPNLPILTIPTRKMHYPFLFGEAWWILSGRDDVPSIEKYNRHITKFSDNGRTFFGAYGPRFRDQVEQVVHLLGRDLESRQAVINIWQNNPPETKDVPCTLNVQFLVRNNKLVTIVNMRSSDAWLGLVYDAFNFAMMSFYVWLRLREDYALELDFASNVINMGSAHIYDVNKSKVEKCLAHEGPVSMCYLHPENFETASDLVEFLKYTADLEDPLGYIQSLHE